MIWRSSALACSELSSKPSAFFICSRASFSLSSFSFVLSIACAKYSCFCLTSSVFAGSSFRSLLTSLSPLLASDRDLFTSFSESSSFVTSPFISIVIPLIRLCATVSPSYKLPELRLCRFLRIINRVITCLCHHVQHKAIFQLVHLLNRQTQLFASEQICRCQDFSDCWLIFFFELATCTAPLNQRSTISGRI